MRNLILASVILLTACNAPVAVEDESVETTIDKSDFIDSSLLISEMEASELSDSEISGLLLMREEEKLAHDVYRTLGDKWSVKIFNNIADSEQTHTEAVKDLLDLYDIDDPVKNSEIGVFENEELAKLYNDLVSEGEKSLLDALKVGATVEDLDIKDLNDLMAETENEAILAVYKNLVKGSRNHLRSFNKQIERNGGSYEAQFISDSELSAILSSNQERGYVQ